LFEPKKRNALVDRVETSPPIRILVVDDHGLVREALIMLIERHAGMTVVGSVADGADAVSAAVRLQPDLILMDLVLRDMNGTEAIRHILALLPLTRIIVLSACHTTEHVCRALRAGARGYVLKEAVCAELLSAISTVTSGEQFLSTGITPLLVHQMMSDPAVPSPMETLSARERQVLHRIVAGASSAEIAAHLFLSRKTVDTYRGRLMTKLGVGNRSALIRLAIEHERAAL
jgi:DNA-binding NarL/FixJ family response regulator